MTLIRNINNNLNKKNYVEDKKRLKLGQKSAKTLVGILGDLKTPKIHSEIDWPLEREPKYSEPRVNIKPLKCLKCKGQTISKSKDTILSAFRSFLGELRRPSIAFQIYYCAKSVFLEEKGKK
jgi:hypothetical protein